jgi:hypothetical protein
MRSLFGSIFGGGRSSHPSAPQSWHVPCRTLARVRTPEPLLIAWRGRQLRIRHDDPHLGPYSSLGATIRSAVELATDVNGLRLVLMTTVGDRYRVRVSDDGSVVGLWRISEA